ncbi:MAG: hypothetical protein WC676_01540 [Candidatus Omnitrophota bacterium]
MISSQKSQSIIEFSVVIVLVLAGIILMGPSTIRGINAHFKSWQDSGHDSMKDPLLPAVEYPAPPNCGNGAVDPGETLTYCCQDFPMTDGDGVCCTVGGETAVTSPNDCAYCGDLTCNADHPSNPETWTTSNLSGYCCGDCSSPNDNFCCTANGVISRADCLARPAGDPCVGVGRDLHSTNDCPAPCPMCSPPDGICADGYMGRPACGESWMNCPEDCMYCGSGRCDVEIGETIQNCPTDCCDYGGEVQCGDHICNEDCESPDNYRVPNTYRCYADCDPCGEPGLCGTCLQNLTSGTCCSLVDWRNGSHCCQKQMSSGGTYCSCVSVRNPGRCDDAPCGVPNACNTSSPPHHCNSC